MFAHTLLYLLQNVKYLGGASSNKEHQIYWITVMSHSAMHHSSHEGWSEAKERDRFVGEIELVEQHFDCPGGQVACWKIRDILGERCFHVPKLKNK